MNHVFHPDTALEFEEGVRYYRARGRVLGDRFAAEVRLAMRRVLETPERWRVLEDDVRRCVARVFPYSVLYTIPSHCFHRWVIPGAKGQATLHSTRCIIQEPHSFTFTNGVQDAQPRFFRRSIQR